MLEKWRGELATFAATLFWGSSFVAIKMGLEHIDPIPFVVMRFLFASIFFTIIFFAYKKTLKVSLLRNRFVYLMAVFNAAGFMLQYVGLDHTSAIKGSLLININVIFVMLVAHFFLGELVTKKKLVSVIGGVFGIFLLVTEGDLSLLASGTIKGDVIVLLGGTCWAFYIALSRKVVKDGACIFELNYMLIILTTVLLAPFYWGSEFDITASNLMYIVYVAFFCTIVTFMLWTYGLKTISATASSVIMMNEVVFATMLGIILLGERLNIYGFLGAIVMLFSIANISLERKRKSVLRKS